MLLRFFFPGGNLLLLLFFFPGGNLLTSAVTVEVHKTRLTADCGAGAQRGSLLARAVKFEPF